MKNRFAGSHLALWFLVLCIFLSACSEVPQPQPEIQNEAPERPPVYKGFHDVTNCDEATGWAWDMNRPDEPIQVEVYDGDTLVAIVTAGDFRQDLLDSGIGNGRHSFTYPISPRLKDGKPHSIKIKYAGTNRRLDSTPKNITCIFEQ
jgi:hypothetical protein